MQGSEEAIASRDCEVIQIPSGAKSVLRGGSHVQIMQALGGTHTVMTDDGLLVRIANKDADALGKEVQGVPSPDAAEPRSPEELEQLVWDQLRTCYDPEIPINIADLGLVYGCEVTRVDGQGYRVDIRMTLTAPGCGMGDVLKAEIESKVSALPTVKDLDVELVFDPPWDYSMIPDASKLTLGMY